MRKLSLALCLALLATVVAVPSASAELGGPDTRPCVTGREYRAVKKGMSKTRVHRIFDTKGQLSSRNDGYEFRDYRPCTGFLDYTLRYYQGRLDGKL